MRAAARRSGRPLIDVAAEVAQAVQAGRLEATDTYAWFALVLRPSPAHGKHPITAFLDGQRNLGDIARAPPIRNTRRSVRAREGRLRDNQVAGRMGRCGSARGT